MIDLEYAKEIQEAAGALSKMEDLSGYTNKINNGALQQTFLDAEGVISELVDMVQYYKAQAKHLYEFVTKTSTDKELLSIEEPVKTTNRSYPVVKIAPADVKTPYEEWYGTTARQYLPVPYTMAQKLKNAGFLLYASMVDNIAFHILPEEDIASYFAGTSNFKLLILKQQWDLYTTRTSFMKQLRDSLVCPSDIEQFVYYWHEKDTSTTPLHDFLGLTFEEYGKWLSQGDEYLCQLINNEDFDREGEER